MKKSIYNNDNLTEDKIDEVITRIKILLVNKNNELLLGYSNGIYQFVGGHLEENESIIDCINREIQEETGIELNVDNVEAFFTIEHYNKNYHDSGLNRLSRIYYFVINSDKEINLNNTNYTEDELKGKFELRYVNLDNIKEVLIENIPNNERNKIIVNEMLQAIEEYKNYIK